MVGPVRAAVKTDIEKTEIQEFERPRIAPEAGLLRVESSGVGGSDPEMYRRPNTSPCIMGHEIVGTIDELGDVAAARWGVAVGDRVALHEYLPCWHCHWCKQGDFRLCMEADFFNVKDRFNTVRFGTCNAEIPPHLWGGNAQYVYMPANTVMHKISHRSRRAAGHTRHPARQRRAMGLPRRRRRTGQDRARGRAGPAGFGMRPGRESGRRFMRRPDRHDA